MNSAQSKTTTMRRHRSQRAATDTVSPATSIAQRVGFTLVELLMVILIIGILVSMLVVAVNPVLERARETAVAIEMKQIDLAIEQFNTKYGFYPPSFTSFDQRPVNQGGLGAVQLLPFLNKISPNHQEGNGAPGTLLSIWWSTIGSVLDDRGSLIFWLNGLSNNKQFPITGDLGLAQNGNIQLPVIFNADVAIQVNMSDLTEAVGEFDMEDDMGNPVSLERESLFDFKGGQLSREFFNYELAVPALDETDPGIRVYNSPHGNAKFDLAYRYRSAGPRQSFYDDPFMTGGVAFHVNTDRGRLYLNPNTFQLSTLGLDGRLSQYFDANGVFMTFRPTAINKPSTGTAEQRNGWQEFTGDNIANFANGRLDGFDFTEAVELGTRNPE